MATQTRVVELRRGEKISLKDDLIVHSGACYTRTEWKAINNLANDVVSLYGVNKEDFLSAYSSEWRTGKIPEPCGIAILLKTRKPVAEEVKNTPALCKKCHRYFYECSCPSLALPRKSKSREPYGDKLRDPRWQKIRLKVFERDGWKCKACGATDKELHVHHWKYSGEPWDAPLEDMSTCCKDCHSETHLAEDLKKLFLKHRERGMAADFFFESVSTWAFDGKAAE